MTSLVDQKTIVNSDSNSNDRVLIFTATYNEKTNIEFLLERIFSLQEKYEVLIIDDNSPDGTGLELEKIRQSHPQLHIIHRPGKLGLGSAHQLAMFYAIKHGYDSLVTMDADLSHNPEDIPRLLDKLADHEFVIGSRYVKGGNTDYGGYRRFLSVTANGLASTLLRLPVHEYTTSFRAFRVETLKKICFTKLRTTGYAFFMESIFWIGQVAPRLGEIPINFHDRHSGVSKIPKFEVFQGIKKLFALTLIAWFGKKSFDLAEPVQDQCNFCDSHFLIEWYARKNIDQTTDKNLTSSFQCSSMSHNSKPRVVLCLKCGLLQVPLSDQRTNLEEIYEDVEDVTYLENQKAREKTFEYIFQRITPYLPHKGSLLEIGAYCGLFLKVATDKGWDAVGVEPSKWAAKIARDTINANVLTGTLAENADKLPENYDVVVSWDVLEHVRNPAALLSEANAKLTPGGILCFSTLDMDNWFPKLFKSKWPWLMEMHLYYFTHEVLERILNHAGFDLLDYEPYRHYASLRYLWLKGSAILPAFLGNPLRPIHKLLPESWLIPVSFGDVKLYVARKRSHDIQPESISDS